MQQRASELLKKLWAGIMTLPRVRTADVLHTFESYSKKELLSALGLSILFLASAGFLIFGNYSKDNGTPDYGGEVVEGAVGQPRFLNPLYAQSSQVDSDLTKLTYAQLMKFDKDLNLVADLAAGWPEASADQKTFVLRLKPNLKWSDGKPLNADDVVFTINMIQDEEYESPERANWSRVKVEKNDDLTLTITLREVSASFITNFTIGILPKHVWDGLSPNNFRLSESNLQPIGSGPFVVSEIKKTSDGTIKSMTLKANEFYHDGRPYLDKFTYKFYSDIESLISAFQGRDINSLGVLPLDKKGVTEPSNRYSQYRVDMPQYQAAFLNLQKSTMLSEKALRQALSQATDRGQIIRDVYLDLAKESFGPILEGNMGYNPSIKENNKFGVDLAIETLEKAGWKVGDDQIRAKGDKKLQLNLVTSNNILNVKTAQLLKEQWGKANVDLQLTIVSPSELKQNHIRPRSFDVLLFLENTGADPDPFPFWHTSQSRDPGLNLSGFTNADADKLLMDARKSNDPEKRAQLYSQFQTIIAEEAPAIFLLSPVYLYNLPKKVQGVALKTFIQPSDRYTDIKNWYIETK